MRLRTRSSFASLLLLLPLAGCGDDVDGGYVCGPGTVPDDGQCVPEGGGGPDASPGAAPTVSSIEPASGLVGGGEPFTITGSGFESSGAGDTTVWFGDSVASFEIVSDSEITGTTPRASAASVTVTVGNQNGSATADFAYRGIYGADGMGALAGNLYLIDPRDGASVVIGAIASGAGGHAVTGLAFDADGTLWASDATSGLEDGPAPLPQLLTIDPASGAATMVGALVDVDEVNHRSVADLTVAGTTLMGWTRNDNAPVTIDTATGAVTVLQPFGDVTYGGGMVTTGDGTVLAFPSGANEFFYSIDSTTGEATQVGPLDSLGNASVCGATRFRGTIYLLLCPHLEELGGSVLATFDPAEGAITNIAPGPLGIDAIASDEPEATTAALYAPATPRDRAALALMNRSCSDRVAVAGRTLASRDLAAQPGSVAVRTKREGVRGLPLARVASGEVEVITCGGSSIRVLAGELDRFALVSNRRGLIKLVDAASGRTVARSVVEIR
jgi:hypothetical protein